MASSYEDAVFDFDLNYLRQNTNNTSLPVQCQSKIEKQRKAVLITKKKIVATNSLIQKYHAKKDLLDHTDKLLVASKEECKKICIEYKTIFEKFEKLERASEILRKKNEELEENTLKAENLQAAAQSFSHQLELLLKDRDAAVEALKAESKLEKANIKEFEKQLSFIQKEKDGLSKNLTIIADLVFHKKKLSRKDKIFLKKFSTQNGKEHSRLSEEENSGSEVEVFEDIAVTPVSRGLEGKVKVLGEGTIVKQDLISKLTDHELDIVSVDTGRGSSLGFSDSDKCFHSPDYYINDSPISVETFRNKMKHVDSATSPVTVKQTANIATSPVIFDHDITKTQADKEKSKTQISIFDEPSLTAVLVDKAISPIKFDDITTIDLEKDKAPAGFPNKKSSEWNDTGFNLFDDDSSNDDQIEIISPSHNKSPISTKTTLQKKESPKSNERNLSKDNNIGEKESSDSTKIHIKEIECMELNNSNILFNDNSNDGEIEMILNNMKFSHGLITPIPPTPARTVIPKTAVNVDLLSGCPEAAKLREENKVLHTSIANLAKEVISIKSLLKNHLKNGKDIPGVSNICISSNGNQFVPNKSNTPEIIREDFENQPIPSPRFNKEHETLEGILHPEDTIYNIKKISGSQQSMVVNNDNDICDASNISDHEITLAGADLSKDTDNKVKKKVPKAKNISKLAKLKRKLIPRPKIQKVDLPGSKQLREKLKQLPLCCENIIDSRKLNHKAAYEKAVKIMSELKAKEKISEFKVSKNIKNLSDKELTASKNKNILKENDTEAVKKHVNSTNEMETPRLDKSSSKRLLSDSNVAELKELTDKVDKETTVILNSPRSTRSSSKRSSFSYEKDFVDSNDVLSKELSLNLRSPKSTRNRKKSSTLSPKKDNVESNDLSDDLPKASSLVMSPRSKNGSKYSSLSYKKGTAEPTEVTQKLPETSLIKSPKLVKSSECDILDSIKTSDVPKEPFILVNSPRVTRCVSKRLSFGNDVVQPLELSDEFLETSLDNSPRSTKNIPKCSSLTSEKAIVESNELNHDQPRGPTSLIKSPRSTRSNSKQSPLVSEKDGTASMQLTNEVPRETSSYLKSPRLTGNRSKSSSFSSEKDTGESNELTDDLSKETTSLVKNLRFTRSHLKRSSLFSEKDTAGSTNNNDELFKETSSPLKSQKYKSSNIKRASFSCDKDVIVVLTRTKIEEKITSLKKKIDKAPEVQETEALNTGIKRLRRTSADKFEVQSTRILRSSGLQNTENKEPQGSHKYMEKSQSPVELKSENQNILKAASSPCKLLDYNDLELFSDEPAAKKIKKSPENNIMSSIQNLQDSVMCKMIEKYGISTMKHAPKKISDNVLTSIRKKMEEDILYVAKLPPVEAKHGMIKLVEEFEKMKLKEFLSGLIQYLMNPTRKLEMFNKMNAPPAPQMTKSEQVLLYVVTRLRGCWPGVDLIECILCQIEYSLFKLNHTPEFDAIESMSHFYAILCRYIKDRSRLRLFVLDAMYCIQYKAVPLVKQCMDVWMHILPLAHLGTAKSTLVTCLVYLLHFYKCEDKMNRVQEIRYILSQKYFYQITEWNEPKILDMFKTAIKELKDISAERKMLRLALIILAKRHGPWWTHNKIIKNILQPIIAKEDVTEKTKAFCVSMIGPLVKPYPMDMKVYCEILVNQLIEMLDHNPGPFMANALISSLICMSKHNQSRVIEVLLTWQPKELSEETEMLLKDYIREKPLKVWKAILSKVPLFR